MFKILTIVGARPHFIKASSVSQAIREQANLTEVIVHTGQHYDAALSASLIEELNIPTPKYNLGIGSGSHSWQMGTMLLKLGEVLAIEQPDLVIVYGDTNTTAAGAIVAAKENIPVAHIEAGLREFDKKIPEEINKRLTDSVSDFFFSPTKTGVKNLAREGTTEGVYHVGDVGIDLIHQNLSRIEARQKDLTRYGVAAGAYYFMTCHRVANTVSKENLVGILSIFASLDLPVIFSIHPRTKKAIETFGLTDLLAAEKVRAIPPIGFWETQSLVRSAKCLITDSGGLIKEGYYHKVPAIIIDTQTEWIETIEEGWNHLAGPDPAKILELIRTIERPTRHTNCLGDGTAAQQIIEILYNYLNAKS
ncbi:MAG: non-hydrolyzing UDP-N-acetylglucosamine 2-epimerase [Saprospiraceae bacterium]